MTTIITLVFAFGAAIYAFDNKYILLIVVLLFYIILQNLVSRHRRQKLWQQLLVETGGRTFQLRGFLDSGNALIDPQTAKPVSIISLTVFLQMYPQITADQIFLAELQQVITNGHYIPYQTVGGAGKLFVFAPEKMKINGVNVSGNLLGVAPRNFGRVQYDAILNQQLGGML